MRARLQFHICEFFTYWVSADASFLSYGCSSRELQCPRAPRSQWLLSQPGLISCPVSVVSVTAQHPACFTFFFLKHLMTRRGCCCTYTAQVVSAISCCQHCHSTRSLIHVLPSSPGTKHPIFDAQLGGRAMPHGVWACCLAAGA